MKLKMGKVGESTFNGFNFNDLLEYGANSKKGAMYYKKATGSDFYRDPNNVVRQFVVRHFDHNSKFGDKSKLIKVFKKGTNTEIKYEAGKRLTDFDFTYKNLEFTVHWTQKLFGFQFILKHCFLVYQNGY